MHILRGELGSAVDPRRLSQRPAVDSSRSVSAAIRKTKPRGER
jgi:hypothetical protein